jgi:hypothetical protein
MSELGASGHASRFIQAKTFPTEIAAMRSKADTSRHPHYWKPQTQKPFKRACPIIDC